MNLYREAILEAAERVFGRAGFAKAHMADIAREAGIATGSLYTYFDSKDRIFQSLLEYRGDEFHRRMSEVAAGADAPLLRLRALVRQCFAFIEEHSDMFGLFVELGAKDECPAQPGEGLADGRLPHPSAHDRHARFQTLFTQVVQQAAADRSVRADLTPADLTAFLSGAMHGVIRHWLFAGRTERLAPRADFVVDLFLSGAGGRAQP